MKSVFKCSLILSVLIFLSMAMNSCGSDSTVQPVITPTPALYTVKGVITNSQSRPVVGVNCTLETYEPGIMGSVIYTTQTDSNGNYSFSGITPGRYKLVAAKEGYVKVNTIFYPSDLSSIKYILDIVMVRIDEWSSVMGSTYPYDPGKGYIMVSTRDYEVNPSNDARNNEIIGQDSSNAGVSVEILSNKDGAPVVYEDRGCLQGNGTVEWNTEVTSEKGITHFYNVKIGETCTVSAQKTDHGFLTETDAVAVSGEMNHYILVGGKGGIGGTETPTPTPALTAMSDSAFQKQGLYNQDGSLKENPVIDGGKIAIHGINYIRKKLTNGDSIIFNGTTYPVYASIPENMTIKYAYTTADGGEYFDPAMSGVDGYMSSGKINNGKESVKSNDITSSTWDPDEKVYVVKNEPGFEYYIPYLQGITDNVALVTDYVNGQGSSVGVNHLFPFGWAFDSKFITFNIDWQGIDRSFNGGVGPVINIRSNVKNYIIETANLDPNTEISKITKGNSDNCSYCPDPARWLNYGAFMPIAPAPGFQRNLLRKYTRAGTWILNTHTSDLFMRRNRGGIELPVYDNSSIYPLVIQTWENQNYTLINQTGSLISGVVTSYPGNEAYYTNNVFFSNSAGVISVANNYFIEGIGGLTSRETDGWLGFKGDSPKETMQWDKGEDNADYGGQANKPYMYGGSNSSKSSGTKYSCNLKHSNSFLVNRVAENKIKDKMYTVHYYADIGDGNGYKEVFNISYEWKALDVDKTACKWKKATDGKGTWVPKAVLKMKNGNDFVNPFAGPWGTDIHIIRFKATSWSGMNVVSWGSTDEQYNVKDNVENGEIYTYVASGSSNSSNVKFLLVLTN